MFLLSESEAVELALKVSGLKQSEFANKIGKSQAQVSKYISGNSNPTIPVYIHCMNIIGSHEQGDGGLLDLMNEVSKLNSEKDKSMRQALIGMIKAYKSDN